MYKFSFWQGLGEFNPFLTRPMGSLLCDSGYFTHIILMTRWPGSVDNTIAPMRKQRHRKVRLFHLHCVDRQNDVVASVVLSGEVASGCQPVAQLQLYVIADTICCFALCWALSMT